MDPPTSPRAVAAYCAAGLKLPVSNIAWAFQDMVSALRAKGFAWAQHDYPRGEFVGVAGPATVWTVMELRTQRSYAGVAPLGEDAADASTIPSGA